MELILENCKIVDGTGAPWYRGDVGIAAGKIAKVGNLQKYPAARRIDVAGKVVCPGFIDIHSHDDVSILLNRRADAKVRQGITTQVVGNCGQSAAPLPATGVEELRRTIYLLDPDPEAPWSWQSMEEYLNLIDSERVSCNVVSLIGHLNLRVIHVGFDNRPATASEISAMKETIAECMKAGAAGLSTGLIYPPSAYANTEELVALCETVAEWGGYYATHMRAYDHRLLDSVREAIEIGERTHVPVQISHHVCVGAKNWALMRESFALIESARSRGVDVAFDVYPYAASSTNLSQLIPPWVHEGGVKSLLNRLRSPELRNRLRQEDFYWEPEQIMISSVGSEKGKPLVAKRLSEIAEQRGTDIVDTLCNLIIEESNNISMVAFVQSEENVRLNLKHYLSAVGTDGLPLRAFGEGSPHPRCYATTARLIARYVEDEKLLPLEEAVRKLTSHPARRAGIRDRGMIHEGMAADLVVFHPDAVREQASFTDPHRYPTGFDYVLVNGQIVVDHGEHTGAQPGQAIRVCH